MDIKVLLFLIFFIASPLALIAQEKDPNQILEAIKQQKQSSLIDSLSLSKYEKILIPSLLELLSQQDLVVDVEARPLENFNADRAWINSALTGGNRTLHEKTVSAKENLKGSAFASYDQISEESDAFIKGQKLLWNIISRQEYSSFYDSESLLYWQNEEKNEKQSLKVRVTNSYPAILKQNNFVALKQRFQILEPNTLTDFKFLTIRQYGAKEDLLWFYSPNLKKTRELPGSIRGDAILESLLSLEDLDLISSKAELLEAKFITETETLVPFVNDKSIQNLKFENDPECHGFSSKQEQSENPIASTYLTPRKVFSLELKQLDPFSYIGRQVIYVDALSMLPFLKEVYSQNGSLQKTLIAAYTPVKGKKLEGAKGEEVYFITKLLAAFGEQRGHFATLKTLNSKVCNQVPKELAEQFFDPAGF